MLRAESNKKNAANGEAVSDDSSFDTQVFLTHAQATIFPFAIFLQLDALTYAKNCLEFNYTWQNLNFNHLIGELTNLKEAEQIPCFLNHLRNDLIKKMGSSSIKYQLGVHKIVSNLETKLHFFISGIKSPIDVESAVAMTESITFDMVGLKGNLQLEKLHKQLTPLGLSFTPKTYDILQRPAIAQYLLENSERQIAIHQAVLMAASHANPSTVRKFDYAGKALTALWLANITYNITTSEDKAKTALHEANIAAYSLFFAYGGGILAAPYCAAIGPLAPVCITGAVTASSLIGSYIGDLFWNFTNRPSSISLSIPTFDAKAGMPDKPVSTTVKEINQQADKDEDNNIIQVKCDLKSSPYQDGDDNARLDTEISRCVGALSLLDPAAPFYSNSNHFSSNSNGFFSHSVRKSQPVNGNQCDIHNSKSVKKENEPSSFTTPNSLANVSTLSMFHRTDCDLQLQQSLLATSNMSKRYSSPCDSAPKSCSFGHFQRHTFETTYQRQAYFPGFFPFSYNEPPSPKTDFNNSYNGNGSSNRRNKDNYVYTDRSSNYKGTWC